MKERHLTAVAFYGHKPPQLRDLIARCQQSICARIGGDFVPYELAQVHATLIGLEGVWTEGRLVQAHFAQGGVERPLDLAGLTDFLLHTPLLPMQMRLGGFEPSQDYGFTSFGRHPAERSFDIQRTGAAVLMGWPFATARASDALYRLRREFLRFNARHKYHRSDEDIDNDLYFVLGTLDDQAATDADRTEVTRSIRAELSNVEPIVLDLDRTWISLVTYEDRRLPPQTSTALPLERDGRLVDASALLTEVEGAISAAR